MSREIDLDMLETAAQHFIAIEEAATRDAIEARDRWLAADPAHLEAYGMIADGVQDFNLSKSQPAVAAIGTEVRAKYALRPSRSRIVSIALSAAAVCVMVISVGAYRYATAPRSVTYETVLGERRNVILADGSKVALDSGTRLTVRLGEQRDVELAFGQARFMVAHDPDHPFIVTAGSRTVRAIGTDYVVDHYNGTVTVSLLSGRVRVSTLGKDNWSSAGTFSPEGSYVDLTPGEQLRGDDETGKFVLAHAVPETSMVLWQERKIRLDNEPLESAVARINRYSGRKIVVQDRRIADLRLSGIFPAGDPEAFVEAVTDLLPVKSRSQSDGVVVLSAS